MKRVILLWVPVAFFLAGCIATPTSVEKKVAAESVIKPAEESSSAFPHLFEERDLLLNGVALLNPQDKSEQEKARSVFISLIRRYPESRWRPAAESFVHLIDERDAFREANLQYNLLLEKTEEEKTKALQENDHLKETVRELAVKLQSETTALAQENEKLKKDIQRLKALEIELEKRERTLR
jgi:hypothetical protein